MNRHVNAVSGRLSLRRPLRESLAILDCVTDLINLKDIIDLKDLKDLTDVIHDEFPTVTDFEREFPSLCFALATGVGKTRLMGAFISYLYQAHGLRHYMVLAPNLTIYNKLIADFTPNTPKYVFQGIGEFAAAPPEIITGDDYGTGRGIRQATLKIPGFEDDRVHINIFNISKINSEVRGGASPRIKRLKEVLGQSYFDYLAGLPDLVLLMDESHRYRASAGVKAINELKPLLGLELTATPFTEEAGGPRWFKNVILSYPLHKAMEDGFTKEPTVATRADFDPSSISPAQLERIKLEDGIRLHEDTKVQLEVYARQNDRPIIKPFMLVVAQDVHHANEVVALIQREDFFDGRYKDRVITVHSGQRGAERDDIVQQLLSVEDPANPTEIVVHVNMLKEGWDVSNLYTIVPLRAARSRTLVEQCVGRGLRLPYGTRTGVAAVDRLTIVAHDMFQAIIDEANDPDSIIKTGVVIGRDVAVDSKQAITIEPVIANIVSGRDAGAPGQVALPFATTMEQAIARTTLQVIHQYENLQRSSDMTSPDVQANMINDVRLAYRVDQPAIDGIVDGPDFEDIVARTTAAYIEKSIDIPRIIVVPTGEVTTGFKEFDLDLSAVRYQPVAQEILIHHLRTNLRERLLTGDAMLDEPRLENYIVRVLMDHADICYDQQSELLYNLSGPSGAPPPELSAGRGCGEECSAVPPADVGNSGSRSDCRCIGGENATGYEARCKQRFSPPCDLARTAPAQAKPRGTSALQLATRRRHSEHALHRIHLLPV